MKVYILYRDEADAKDSLFDATVFDTEKAARKAFAKELKKVYDDGYDEEDRTFDECVKQMEFSMTYEDEPFIKLFVKAYDVQESK